MVGFDKNLLNFFFNSLVVILVVQIDNFFLKFVFVFDKCYIQFFYDPKKMLFQIEKKSMQVSKAKQELYQKSFVYSRYMLWNTNIPEKSISRVK